VLKLKTFSYLHPLLNYLFKPNDRNVQVRDTTFDDADAMNTHKPRRTTNEAKE